MFRREFLGTAALAAAAAPIDLSLQCRKDFPRAMNETYFNSAAQHPLGNHVVAGMQRYMDFLHKGPGEGRKDFWEDGFQQVKPMFAKLINAKPSEIAFSGSTTIGENTILNGMDLRGGNVVTNDLHYTASLSNYLTRQKIGSVVKPTEFTGHPDFNYAPWTTSPKAGPAGLINHAAEGVAAFDCGTQSVITYAAQYEALRYIEKIGIANIRSHANRLIARLQKELPLLGYTSITPKGTESSIMTLQRRRGGRRKIRASKAKILLTGPNSALTVGRFGNHIRFSVSVFNNDKDIDTIVEVLT